MINYIQVPICDYSDGLEIMNHYLNRRTIGKIHDTVILIEHHNVYTAGLTVKKLPELENNIPFIITNRGGKITYHGPGQRVIYPIINLDSAILKKDIHLYINKLQQSIINSLAKFDINAFTIEKYPGVWVKKNNQMAKIAFIGIRIKKWVSFHGCAINIASNLEYYNDIISCGIENCLITSCHDLGKKISIEEFDTVFKEEFNKLYKPRS